MTDDPCPASVIPRALSPSASLGFPRGPAAVVAADKRTDRRRKSEHAGSELTSRKGKKKVIGRPRRRRLSPLAKEENEAGVPGGRMDGLMEGQTCGRTDVRALMDGQTDGRSCTASKSAGTDDVPGDNEEEWGDRFCAGVTEGQ